MFPTRIYLSGGGICAIAHVGALQELSRHIPLQGIKEWMGVSAGSLMAMCLVTGFTLDELYDFSIRFDFTQIQEPDSPTGWILHMGMDTGERLHRLVSACLRVKGLSAEITFGELYRHSGLSLRILATDMNTAKGVCFSPTDTPDYSVAIAVCASMAYPYYYQPVVCPTTGHSLIDGGVISNYPMYLLPAEEHARTLCLLLHFDIQTAPSSEDLPPQALLVRPLFIALTEKTNQESALYPTTCIRIPMNDVNVFDFALSEETKQSLVARAQEAVRTWSRARPLPVRRNSV